MPPDLSQVDTSAILGDLGDLISGNNSKEATAMVSSVASVLSASWGEVNTFHNLIN